MFAVPGEPYRKKVPPVPRLVGMPQPPGSEEQQLSELPFGYELLAIEDKRCANLTNTIMDVGVLAGDGGIRHLEIKRIQNTHLKIIAVGMQNSVHMDDILRMVYPHDRQKLSTMGTGYVQDAYINPCLPVKNLDPRWALSSQEPKCFPAFVVQVPTLSHMQRSNTRLVDNTKKVNLNGSAPLLAEIFPGLVDLSSASVDLGAILAPQKPSFKTLYTQSPRGENTVQEVECVMGSGTMSPRQRPIPNISFQLMTHKNIEDLEGPNWRSPIPRTPGTDAEFNDFVAGQLDTMLKYMYSVHSPIGSTPAQRDVPSELRVIRLSDAPRVYACQALGYSARIGLLDMLRLYSVDPSHIQNIYFDFTCKPRDTSKPYGALVVELQVELNPVRPTLYRIPGSPNSALDPTSTGLVTLTRIKGPEQELPAAEEPMEEDLVPHKPVQQPFRVIEPPTRKRKEIVVQDSPAPSAGNEQVAIVSHSSPAVVHEEGMEPPAPAPDVASLYSNEPPAAQIKKARIAPAEEPVQSQQQTTPPPPAPEQQLPVSTAVPQPSPRSLFARLFGWKAQSSNK